MVHMLVRNQVRDFDVWKRVFDEDRDRLSAIFPLASSSASSVVGAFNSTIAGKRGGRHPETAKSLRVECVDAIPP